MDIQQIDSIQNTFNRLQEISNKVNSFSPPLPTTDNLNFAKLIEENFRFENRQNTGVQPTEALPEELEEGCSNIKDEEDWEDEPIHNLNSKPKLKSSFLIPERKDFTIEDIHKLEPKKKIPLSKKFDAIIDEEAKKNGIESALIKAVIKAESNFNPKATSHVGAKGLMQLMPNTAKLFGVKDILDPEENIKGGASYLKDMLDTFKDRDKAIAAYNAGPGAVRKHKGVPPYSETQSYVRKVNKYYEEFKND